MSRTLKFFIGLVLLFPLAARAQEDLTIRVIPRFGLLNPAAIYLRSFPASLGIPPST
jgi:hypothetical protein